MLATPGSFYLLPGLPNILARFSLLQGYGQSEALPSDQWMQEMEFISQASLASFQSNVPQASQNGVWYLNRTLCEDETVPGLCEKLCRSQVSPHHRHVSKSLMVTAHLLTSSFQKVRSSSYFSFNVLGTSIILFVGLFFMLLGAFIETIATSIGNTFHPDKQTNPPYSRLEWNSTSYLDLQRLAHQALGIGTWSRSRIGIPITVPGEDLGVVSAASQSKLPVLKGRRKESGLQDGAGRTDYSHDYALDDLDPTGYQSPRSSLLDPTRTKPQYDVLANDSSSRTLLPSRFPRRSGYARVYTNEEDTIHPK